MLRQPLANRDADRTPTGNDTSPQAGLDFGLSRPLTGRTFTHPSIQCRADEIFAAFYVMPDGNTVKAFCRISALEWYATLSEMEKTGHEPHSDENPLL